LLIELSIAVDIRQGLSAWMVVPPMSEFGQSLRI
jgi:hypothetical protein